MLPAGLPSCHKRMLCRPLIISRTSTSSALRTFACRIASRSYSFTWLYLPKDLPPKSTVHDYLTRWNYDGTLERIHHALYVQCREVMGRAASPTACVIDSQSVKSAEKGGCRSIRPAMMRAKRSRARSGVCHEH